MNVKKTIASIAAIAMVASATSLAPLFTGTSISAEEDNTPVTDVAENGAETSETETDPEETEATNTPVAEVNPNDGIAFFAAGNANDHATETTMDVDNADGTSIGTVTKGQNGNDYHVAVKLNSPNATVNGCHVVIPIDGLAATGWSFSSGYTFDNDNHNWNIDNGYLRLWLTGIDRTYKIGLSGPESATKTVYVTFDSSAAGALGATVDGNAVPADNVSVETGASGAIEVSVTLPDGAAGETENGSGNANSSRKDYYLVIPVAGIDSSWTFKSGWGYDEVNHHEFNISNNTLKLWVPVGDDTTHTIVLTNGTQEKTIVIKTNPAADVGSTVTVGNTADVDNTTVKNGTGAAAVTTVDGTKTVTVTLTSEAGKTIGGMPEGGVAGEKENYYITIPVTGLSAEWVFESGYGFDDGAHHEFNITTDKLMLWLPVTAKTHTIVLKKGEAAGAETLTIKVKTVVVNTPAEEEPGDEPGIVVPTEPTDAEKVDAVKTELAPDVAAAKDSWNFEGKTHEEAEAIVRDWFASQGYEFAGNVEIVFNWQEENSGVWIGFNITFGDEHEYGLGAWKNYTAPVVVPGTPAPVVPYYPPVVSSNPVNPSISSVQPVTSSAQISVTKQKEVTIDAAKTDVTPAMVKAFIKNKNTKTLTLKYSSSLKISIDKANIKDASADLDFSVSGKKFLSSKLLKKLGSEKVVQLDFVNKGRLDGVEKATVKVRVGANYIGKTVTIYEYKDGKLVKVGKAAVNGAGIVKFNTNRLSQFVLAVE